MHDGRIDVECGEVRAPGEETIGGKVYLAGPDRCTKAASANDSGRTSPPLCVFPFRGRAEVDQQSESSHATYPSLPECARIHRT